MSEAEAVTDEIETEDESEDEVEEEVDYDEMSKAELVALAEEQGLDPSGKKKVELVAMLSGEAAPEAPVSELIPVVRIGDWVRLQKAKGVPTHLVNRDAVVLRATSKRAEGGDALSPTPYEYQDGSEVFQVRVRATGDELSVTRAAFRAHGTQQAELGAA